MNFFKKKKFSLEKKSDCKSKESPTDDMVFNWYEKIRWEI